MNLRTNKLEILPSYIFSLALLSEIDLWGNNLSKFPMIEQNKNSQVQKLNLSMNNFSELSMGLKALTKLRVLELSNNHLKVIPTVISNMKSLKLLLLNHNQIVGYDLSIRQAAGLEFIGLDANPITVSKLNELKSLLPNCKINME